MKTKTNAPAEAAKIITVTLVIILIAVTVALTQLQSDRQMDPGLHGSSDQTITPMSQPQAPPR